MGEKIFVRGNVYHFLPVFGKFLLFFFVVIGPFWRGVASFLSILAAAKQGVYSQEYTTRGIPRALLVGLLIEILGWHLMDPGMDRRAAVFVLRRVCVTGALEHVVTVNWMSVSRLV